MIKKCISGAATLMGIAGLVRASRDRLMDAPRRRTRYSEEGSLLVEVLVGMLVLIFVFTVTTIALSSMADQRVRIEQRDRALALVSSYEEKSRVFGCGFLVDRIQDSLTQTATVGSGKAEFENRVTNCDFAAAAQGAPVKENSGDQEFVVKEPTNGTGGIETFEVSIRYWWEVPGKNLENAVCSDFKTLLGPTLPLILARGIQVRWREKGVDQKESIVKRDPVPSDDVVFVSGNRVNLLVNSPGTTPWQSVLTPVLDPTKSVAETSHYIRRISDDVFKGQPKKCAWYPFITNDGDDRSAVNVGVPNSSLNATIPDNFAPQDFWTVS